MSVKNINSMLIVIKVKVINFKDKKPGFLEIIEVCLNLDIGFCIT